MSPVRLRLLAPALRLPSILMQAVAIERALREGHPDRVQVDLVRAFPLIFMADRDAEGTRDLAEKLASEVDVLVVVKSTLFRGFETFAPVLKEACQKAGAALVSHPCDGPGADGGEVVDPFSVDVADAALAISRVQLDALAAARHNQGVFYVGHAHRVSKAAPNAVRDTVRRVLWENPLHRNPGITAATAPEALEDTARIESLLAGICQDHGAELQVLNNWAPPLDDAAWIEAMRGADVAVECKALEGRHGDYLRAKPALKVLNYMALGIPVVCDSVPAYRDVGMHGVNLLFADTEAEWRTCMERLFADCPLRRRLSEGALDAASAHHIDTVIERWVQFAMNPRGVSGRPTFG